MSSVYFNPLAVILSPIDAPYGAFSSIHQDVDHRVKALRKKGWCVDQTGPFATPSEVATHLEKEHPHGMQMQIWRGYGNEKEFFFSRTPEGRVSELIDDGAKDAVGRICRLVNEGGILFTESSCNGAGKKNLSKFLASLCNPRVCVIGSQKEEFEIDLLPALPQYPLCCAEGKDATRMYYKTPSGRVQNIHIGELQLLWGILGGQEEVFPLCLNLLGCKKEPERLKQIKESHASILSSYLGDVEKIKELLKQTNISALDVGSFWQEVLTEMHHTLELESSIETIHIPTEYRAADLWVQRSESGEEVVEGITVALDDKIRAYFFVLGIAILDRYRVLLSLFDDGNPSADGTFSQCVHAISGLAIHSTFGRSLSESMHEAIATVKQSYLQAKDQRDTSAWIHKLALQKGTCDQEWLDMLQRSHEQNLLANSTDYAFAAKSPPNCKALWKSCKSLHAFQGKERFDYFKQLLRKKIEFCVAQGELNELPALRALKKIDEDDSKTLEDRVEFVRSMAEELYAYHPMLLDSLISADFFEALTFFHVLIAEGAFKEQETLYLHKAVMNNQLGSLWMLLELGADPDEVDDLGNTALHLAVNHGWINGIQVLRKGGANLAIQNHAGWTPHNLAEMQDNWEAGQAILGENDDLPILLGDNALISDTISPREDFFFLPDDAIFNRHQQDGNQRFKIFQQNVLGRMRQLRVDLPDSFQKTPANMEQQRLWIKKLLRCLYTRDLHQYAFSILQAMIELNYFEGIRCFSTDLLQIPDAMGYTPLHRAAFARQIDSLKVLLDLHMPLDEFNSTPLLLNEIDASGNTALHIATAKRWVEGVKLLRIAGIDQGIRNHAGKTALDLARESRNDEMLRVLEGSG